VPGVAFGLVVENSNNRRGKRKIKTSVKVTGAAYWWYLYPLPLGRLRQAWSRRIQSPLYKDYPPRWRLSPTDIYPSCCAQQI